MLLDLIDLAKLRRIIIYILLFAVLFLVQDLLLSHITILGVKAMLIPAAVVAIGLYEGGLWGGLIGLAAGYFCDRGYTEQLILFTILFPATGFFAGLLGKYLFQKAFLAYMTLVLMFTVVITFCQMFPFLFLTDTNDWIVCRTGIIQVLWSLPWAIPIYFPCRAIAERSLK